MRRSESVRGLPVPARVPRETASRPAAIGQGASVVSLLVAAILRAPVLWFKRLDRCHLQPDFPASACDGDDNALGRTRWRGTTVAPGCPRLRYRTAVFGFSATTDTPGTTAPSGSVTVPA